MRDTIEHAGRTFAVRLEHDDVRGPPWNREDGHGPVSDWKRARSHRHGTFVKSPGEMILHEDCGSFRTYDFQEACRIARRDGWGDVERLPGWNAATFRKMFPGDTPARHRSPRAYADFDRLRRWCNGDWHYVGVVVTLLDEEGDETDEVESLWGIESDAATISAKSRAKSPTKSRIAST